MSEGLLILGLIGAWFLLQIVILPKMGIDT